VGIEDQQRTCWRSVRPTARCGWSRSAAFTSPAAFRQNQLQPVAKAT